MNISIILVVILTAFAAVAKEKTASLPSYSPNNPYGKWATLPKGKSYLFCGDRILFGSDLKKKIKLQYGDQEREMSLADHCEFRRKEFERLSKTRVSEEPSLVELQYEKLSTYFRKINGGKIRRDNVYSLRELRKAMKASEINELRAANMMLPILAPNEFSNLYAGETNNPQFIKTEYERYASNLITQNAAMLYTANGTLYYFSLNLSGDQLALIGNVLRGGGSGAGSSGGGNFGGGKGGGVGAGGIAGVVARAVEGAKANPFSGFGLGSSRFQIRPQSTTLPESFGLASNVGIVPYDFKIPSGGGSADRGVASEGRGSSSSSRAKSSGSSRSSSGSSVSVSANPALSMMGLTPGGSRVGGNVGRTSSGYTSSRVGSGVASASGPAKISATTKPALTLTEPNTSKGLEVASAGPPPIVLDRTDYRAFEKENFTCKSNEWEQFLYIQYDERAKDKRPQPSDLNCFPKSENIEFCGQGNKSEGSMTSSYNNRCGITEGVGSCYNQINRDIKDICSKYITLSEAPSQSELMMCAEVMSAFACNKIPCEISDKKRTDDGLIKQLEIVLHDEGRDIFTKLTLGGVLIPNDKVKSLQRISGTKEYRSDKILDVVTLLNLEKWPEKLKPTQLKEDILKLSLYYNYEIANKCKFDSTIFKPSVGNQ